MPDLPNSISPLRRFALLAVLALPLAGCTTIRQVNKTVVAPHLMDATLDQLLSQMNARYTAVQTMNASVDISSSTGGTHQGQIKENPTLAGYIILRKPMDLRILMLAPVLRSRAIDMVSDGKTFKLLITPPATQAKGIEGPEKIGTPSKNGLDNLRPYVIRDALLIPPVQPDEFTLPTNSSRIMAPANGRKEAIEEPDYDLSIVHTHGDHLLELVRVIHISRITLLPYEQDIYSDGHIVQTVMYDKYQKFGEVDFPTSIAINRPLDEYSVKIEISKLTINGKVDDEQFVLNFPEGLAVRKMP